MSTYQQLTIQVRAGVLSWLESEAAIINRDLRALGQPADVSAEDVAMVLLERGIAATLDRPDQAPPERERVVGA